MILKYKGIEMERPDLDWRELTYDSPGRSEMMLLEKERLRRAEEKAERDRFYTLSSAIAPKPPAWDERDADPIFGTFLPSWSAPKQLSPPTESEMAELEWKGQDTWEDLDNLRKLPKPKKEKKMKSKSPPPPEPESIPLHKQEMVDIVPHDVIAEVERMANAIVAGEQRIVPLAQRVMNILKQLEDWEDYCLQLGWDGIWFELPRKEWEDLATNSIYQPITRGVAMGRLGDRIVVLGNVEKITPHSSKDPLTYQPDPNLELNQKFEEALQREEYRESEKDLQPSELDLVNIQTQKREAEKYLEKAPLAWMGTWNAPSSDFPKAETGQAWLILGDGEIKGTWFSHGEVILRQPKGWTKLAGNGMTPETVELARRASYTKALDMEGVRDVESEFDPAVERALNKRIQNWSRQPQIVDVPRPKGYLVRE